MEKLNDKELLNCTGGSWLSCISILVSILHVTKLVRSIWRRA